MPEKAKIEVVGVDVAKASLEYAIEEGRTERVDNTVNGVAQLIGKLRALPGKARIIVESTGSYHLLLAQSALKAGLEVCVVQPGRARAFAIAEGTLGKTDKLDAQMLRRYGCSVDLPLMQAIDSEVEILQDLLDRRRDVVERLVEIDNQLESARRTKKAWLEKEKDFLNKQQEKLDKAIARHVAKNESLRNKIERLQQLNGVGPVVSTTLVAYVPELGTIEGGTVCALVGVAPFPDDSGNQVGERHIRGGRPHVRHVLYMAAVTAARTNPILSQLYQRMLAKGKKPKVCLVAIMRRMLLVLNRLLADPDFCLVR